MSHLDSSNSTSVCEYLSSLNFEHHKNGNIIISNSHDHSWRFFFYEGSIIGMCDGEMFYKGYNLTNFSEKLKETLNSLL